MKKEVQNVFNKNKEVSENSKVLITHADPDYRDTIVSMDQISNDPNDGPEYLLSPKEWSVGLIYDNPRVVAYHEHLAPEGKEVDEEEFQDLIAQGWKDTPAGWHGKKNLDKKDAKDSVIDGQDNLIKAQSKQIEELQAKLDQLLLDKADKKK